MTKTRYTFVEDTDRVIGGGFVPFEESHLVKAGVNVIEKMEEVKEPVVQTFRFTQAPDAPTIAPGDIRRALIYGTTILTYGLVIEETTP